jgi:hypothetical protein
MKAVWEVQAFYQSERPTKREDVNEVKASGLGQGRDEKFHKARDNRYGLYHKLLNADITTGLVGSIRRDSYHGRGKEMLSTRTLLSY